MVTVLVEFVQKLGVHAEQQMVFVSLLVPMALLAPVILIVPVVAVMVEYAQTLEAMEMPAVMMGIVIWDLLVQIIYVLVKMVVHVQLIVIV
jgi:hypothetical protein